MTTTPSPSRALHDAAAALQQVHDDLAEVIALFPLGIERDRLHTIALAAFRGARFAETPDSRDDVDPDGWQTPPPPETHAEAVRDLLAGVVALRAEMGDQVPASVIAYASELRRATRHLTTVQRARASHQMREHHTSGEGWRPRTLLVAAITAAATPADDSGTDAVPTGPDHQEGGPGEQ